MDLVPYQTDPAIQALQQPRQRILIADAVGLGKTLEAGILVSELIHRGRGKRILVLALKSMLTQFQKEFWNRFTIPLTRLDSVGLQRVRNRIPSNHNPFYYYDKSIISIDTLKQDTEYRVYLEQAYWDIIIIDECHNVAERGTSSQRARLARLLATRSDTLIMLSATPHDGRAQSFASLMNMLDPTAISDPENYAKEDFSHKGLVVRRFKKDIRDQVEGEFKERSVYRHHHAASPEEEVAYAALLEIPFTRNGECVADKRSALLRIGLQKALFSSPAACRKSITQRMRKLEREQQTGPTQAMADELAGLNLLDQQVSRITQDRYSKYQALLALLKNKAFGWNKRTTDDRLVIFSERIETLNFLETQLKQDLKLKDRQITQLHGGMSDQEQQRIVEQFGSPESRLRVLLCSDVASEGINLHYQSHRLIHYDIPWSLMVFQQRNGRIDRYGQEQEPRIDYLITESANPTIRGDMRILEVLEEKDEQAYHDIGDPSVFMGVFDSEEETRLTEEAMAAGQEADAFNDRYQPEKNPGDDLLALFLGAKNSGDPQPAPQPNGTPAIPIDPPLSLFPDHYTWARRALQQLQTRGDPLQWNPDDVSHHLTLTATDELRHRFRFLPREIYPEQGQFILTDDIEVIKQEIARSREDENAWPKIHYLWPQHPIAEWLGDRMLAAFGRHTAPVIELPEGLSNGESVFIIN
ncbi:MAG: DEAD/DEAH box helicase, partial [Pseudomonadota bacterium]